MLHDRKTGMRLYLSLQPWTTKRHFKSLQFPSKCQRPSGLNTLYTCRFIGLQRTAPTARGSTLESTSLTRCLGTKIPLAPRYPTNIFDPQPGFAVLVSLAISSNWESSISVYKARTERPNSCICRSVLELTSNSSAIQRVVNRACRSISRCSFLL